MVGLLGVSIIAGSGCSESKERRQVVVRDSADIVIVQHDFRETQNRIVTAVPALDLSAGAGPEHEFFSVTDAAIMADGSLIVLNTGTQEVRAFSDDGTFIRKFGRRGNGPGEFGFPYGVWELPGGRLLVADFRHQRVSIFDRDGNVMADHALPQTRLRALVLGVVAEDKILLGFPTVVPSGSGFEPQVMQYDLYDFRSGETTSLPSLESGMVGHIGGSEPWGIVGGAIFDPSAHGRGWWGGVVLGTGNKTEVMILNEGGVVSRLVRWRAEAVSVEPRHVEAYKRGVLEELSSRRRPTRERQINASPVADEFPAFDDIRVDAAGRIWVRKFVVPGEANAQTWHVFGERGTPVVDIVLPSGSKILAAVEDAILLVETDSLDVEHVWLYSVDVN